MKNRLLLLLGFTLLLAALFTPVFHQFIREVIVIPLLYLLWIGRFLFEAIPQEVIWAGLSIFLMLIMIVSLLGKSKSKLRLLTKSAPDQGRIESWLDLIQKAERDAYFKWRLAQGLQRLTLDTIAHQADQSLKETRQQLKQGELAMPPEIQAYFQASLKSLGYLSTPKRLLSSKAVISPLDLDPARIAQFIENLTIEPITSSKRSAHDS
jgi:hypothetical protein